jgi:hypothetical protein
VLQPSSLAPRTLIEAANAQAQRSAERMLRTKSTLSFRLHPSALSEAAPRFRWSLLLGDESLNQIGLFRHSPATMFALKEQALPAPFFWHIAVLSCHRFSVAALTP